MVFADHVIGERGLYHLTDQMIDETVAAATADHPTARGRQRAATRQAIIDATLDCLMDDGYSALTTRRIAERAGIAQSTVMHHFETREALLVEAVIHAALGLAQQALGKIDFAALRTPEHREAVLDEAWIEFTSPQALAAAQLWAAVWNEPELAPVLRELEGRVTQIIVTTSGALFPELASDSRLPALLDASVSLIRGLVLAIPVWGSDAVNARWESIKPIILDAAEQLLG